MERMPLVETKNVKEVKTAVRKTLTDNGFLSVIADVGSGKTTIYNHLCDFWSARQHDFSVVEIKSFKQINSRIGIIMKLLLAKIDPELHIPGDAESRYHALEQALRHAYRSGRKVVLIVDEAQDLNMQTMRDLKKIHEIDGFGQDHLFSIILFGKTHRQWDRISELPELGYRIRRVLLSRLTNAEIILFAEQRFNVSFKDNKSAEKFASLVTVKTPLGVYHTANAIRWHRGLEDGEKIQINMEDLKSLAVISKPYRIAQAGAKQKQLEEKIHELYPDKKVNRQRISEWQNGRMDPSHPLYSMIDHAADELISTELSKKSGDMRAAK